jgi:hypothetical protein
MGSNCKATMGHKNGTGNMESAGAQFGREGAFSLVCFEVQDIPQTIPQTDSDGDGLSDAHELMIGTLLNDGDTDNDGVSDYDEVNFDGDASAYNPATDLNPFDVDTDGDGVDDATELSAGTDPLDGGDVPLPGDMNFDGLVNLADYLLLTRFLLGTTATPPTPRELYAGDLNVNAELYVGDLVLLVRTVLGTI